MISPLRFIALSMLVALVISQDPASYIPSIATFDGSTSLNPATTSVQTGTQGYQVSLNGPGWVYGSPIAISPASPTVVWATLLVNQGVTGIGPIAATCTPNYNAVNRPQATFVGTATLLCPGDFATIYTANPTGSTSGNALATNLVVNSPVQWILTEPATTANNVIGIIITNEASLPTTPAPILASTAGARNTDTTVTDVNAGASRWAVAGYDYAYYVETTGRATVCFQTEDQYTISPGDCGEQKFVYGHSYQSASVLSASITVLFASIALIFFN